MFKRLLDWITTPRASRGDASTWAPVAVPVDIDAVDKTLGVSKAAERWGKANLPPANDASIDAGQAQTHGHFTELVRLLHSRVSKRLAEYRTTSKNVDPRTLLSEIEQTPARFSGEAETRLANHRLHLDSIARDRTRAEEDLRGFSSRQELSREPMGPPSRAAYIAIPALCFAIEVVFNSFVFSSANEGLRGGIRVAVIVAAVNIILAAFLGIGVRFVHRKEFAFKTVGALCLLLLLSLLPFNLFVAHYRDIAFSLSDVSALSLDEAERQAMSIFDLTQTSFASHPFRLRGPESLGLFLLGAFFAIISAIDGYKSDDPVPGYQRLHDRVRALERRQALEQRAFNNAMASLRDTAIRQIDDIAERFKIAERNANDRRQMCGHAANIYAQQSEIYRAAYISLVKRYCQENLLHRSDAQVPISFSHEAPDLVVPEIPFSDADELEFATSFADVGRLMPEAITTARRRIEGEWDKVADRLAAPADER